MKHFAREPEHILVHYPGFRSARFTPTRAAAQRSKARRALGVTADAPLVGMITSGDFAKRGLDIFLAAAELIAAARPDARFLVVGSKQLPAAAREHALFANGRVVYRAKRRDPELWFAALDLFLYPARFEEFGMVVSEAQAIGLPVVTSRLVGAAECLPPAYERWLCDRPDAAEFAERTLALLADEARAPRARTIRDREREPLRRPRVRNCDRRAHRSSEAAAEIDAHSLEVVELSSRPPCGSDGTRLSRASLSPIRKSIDKSQAAKSSLNWKPPPR